MDFQTEKLSGAGLKITFGERLDVDSVANIWDEVLSTLKKHKPKSLLLNFNQVNYCDGAGIALIKKLQKNQEDSGGSCTLEGLKKDFQELLDHIKKESYEAKKEPELKESFITRLGCTAVDVIDLFRDNIIFLGMFFYQLFFFLFGKHNKIRWRDILRVAEETGPEAIMIIALIGFLIGLISTFQAAPSFEKFGVQIYMVNLVGLGLVREMGPLLTSVLLAGRTASSFAAEIGTMKINQEIDALNTMGLDPIFFLVVPRVLVTMLVIPILEIFFIIFGLLGCLTVMLTLGYTSEAFFNQLYQAISPGDYIGGLIKVVVFSAVIAGIGCLHGIKTSFGSQAVGRSTTQAVVSSLIMLVILDGIFALIYYILGI